jgi:hypothetical protein
MVRAHAALTSSVQPMSLSWPGCIRPAKAAIWQYTTGPLIES